MKQSQDYIAISREDEDRMADEAFREVLGLYLASHHRKKVEIIERAYRFAREAHRGARRRSGEPYIMHPIAVARIVIDELGLGSTSICAALLHDVVEDTEYTRDDIAANFGEKVASIVEGLTKISGGIFGDRASLQAENFRKLLLSMSTDIRVILIKMADRLHNMRTLASMRPEKQLKIAGETLYVYAPLAHRLGLYNMKLEFEDLAFKFEHPGKYEEIKALVDQSSEHRNSIVEEFVEPVRAKLDEAGFRYTIKARVKSAYSIWRKMETKKVGFDDIYDIYAVRVVFENEDDALEAIRCWQIYTFFTEGHRVHPDRLRDWITTPKTNGYRALHLTVMGPDGKWIEVQIRSRKMDEIAELGYAAHWKYKNVDYEEESELETWMNTIKDILANPEPDAIDFLDTIKLNLFSSEIYVFTPHGDLVTLPSGATVLDMAFAIHTQLGLQCIAGKINHRLVPLSHKLESGDQVEIITSESQKPLEEWLSFCRTAKAKSRIRAVLRRRQSEAVARGRNIYREFLEGEGISASMPLMRRMLDHYRLATPDDLYLKLDKGEVTLSAASFRKVGHNRLSIFGKLLRNPFSTKRRKAPGGEGTAAAPSAEEKRQSVDRSQIYVLHPDADNPNYLLDTCCAPLPGDDVLGFVDDDENVVLHRVDCPKAMRLKTAFGPRLVATRWEGTASRFRAQIEIQGLDRRGMISDIVGVVGSRPNVDIRDMKISADNEVFRCTMTILTDSAATVRALCTRLRKIGNVKSAVRNSQIAES